MNKKLYNFFAMLKVMQYSIFYKSSVQNFTNDKPFKASFWGFFFNSEKQKKNVVFGNTSSCYSKNSWNNTQKTIWWQTEMHSFVGKYCQKMHRKHCLFPRCGAISFSWSQWPRNWSRNLQENRFFSKPIPLMTWYFFKYMAHEVDICKLKLKPLQMVKFAGTAVDTWIMRMLIGRQLLFLLIFNWHFASQQTSVANLSFQRHKVVYIVMHHNKLYNGFRSGPAVV